MMSTVFGILGISDTLAAAPASSSPSGSLASFLPMMLIFIVGIYFLMIRPQNKRAKAHQKLISGLAKGDEIVTAGGIVGKVVKLSDDFVTISVAENVEVSFQRNAVSNVLPKGTLKSIS